MFLRPTLRKKNGKTHTYWNVVENKRLDGGRVVQRQVLYLGEINTSQVSAWRKAIGVVDEEAGTASVGAVPEDRRRSTEDRVEVRSIAAASMRAAAMGSVLAGGSVWRICTWISSGRSGCAQVGKARAGIRCFRPWWPTG